MLVYKGVDTWLQCWPNQMKGRKTNWCHGCYFQHTTFHHATFIILPWEWKLHYLYKFDYKFTISWNSNILLRSFYIKESSISFIMFFCWRILIFIDRPPIYKRGHECFATYILVDKKRNHEHFSSIKCGWKKNIKNLSTKVGLYLMRFCSAYFVLGLPKLSSFPKNGLPPIKW